VLIGAAVAAAVTLLPVAALEFAGSTAQAQNLSVNIQFRSALEPHGRWSKHRRWGEVWIPAKRDRDWRPYTVGRWAYTDEWGWYWASDEDFGYVTYHYGRWVRDSEFGWVWIPGNEWAPAWVQWRRGDRHAGWAPLPPREVYYDYDNDPDYWVFVSFNNFNAPNILRVMVPRQERVVYIRQTVVVNRTIIVAGGSRIAVNPGIEPQIVAARTGRALRVANVQPVVLAGTVGVQGAVEVKADGKDVKRERVRAKITESKETIAPAKEVPAPRALAKDEEGRLGDRPPAAAKEQAQRKPDAAPSSSDGAKASQEDAAKAKQEDSAKAKPEDSTKAGEATPAKSDDAAKAKSGRAATGKPDDAAKAKPQDDAKAAKSKQPESKGEAKPQARESEKGKATERKQAEPKAAAEPKQAAPKAAAPKSAPEPKQAAPKSAPAPKQAAPKSAPEPRQAAPKAAPEPRQAAPQPKQAAPKAEPAPKAAAPKGKKKDDEKG
jgi:hypothetical protein